jgi:Family of unknown function (DUF6282)
MDDMSTDDRTPADAGTPLLTGIVDLHVHASPSLAPRLGDDRQMWAAARSSGAETIVLKAHEGSSAARAALAGPGVIGGVVLNSPVGGANADAVRVAHALGGRVVWMPTISAPAHVKYRSSSELSAHAGIRFREVPIVEDGSLRPEWIEVLEEVAAADLVLASGHLTLDETALLFAAAHRRGIRRLLVNHPGLPFLGWRGEHVRILRELNARLEIGVTCDLICGVAGRPSSYFADNYPAELLVFGSDLGHTNFPEVDRGYRDWITEQLPIFGEQQLQNIMTENGRHLLV